MHPVPAPHSVVPPPPTFLSSFPTVLRSPSWNFFFASLCPCCPYFSLLWPTKRTFLSLFPPFSFQPFGRSFFLGSPFLEPFPLVCDHPDFFGSVIPVFLYEFSSVDVKSFCFTLLTTSLPSSFVSCWALAFPCPVTKPQNPKPFFCRFSVCLILVFPFLLLCNVAFSFLFIILFCFEIPFLLFHFLLSQCAPNSRYFSFVPFLPPPFFLVFFFHFLAQMMVSPCFRSLSCLTCFDGRPPSSHPRRKVEFFLFGFPGPLLFRKDFFFISFCLSGHLSSRRTSLPVDGGPYSHARCFTYPFMDIPFPHQFSSFKLKLFVFFR